MVVQTEEEENFPLQSQHGVKVRNCDTHTHTHTHTALSHCCMPHQQKHFLTSFSFINLNISECCYPWFMSGLCVHRILCEEAPGQRSFEGINAKYTWICRAEADWGPPEIHVRHYIQSLKLSLSHKHCMSSQTQLQVLPSNMSILKDKYTKKWKFC